MASRASRGHITTGIFSTDKVPMYLERLKREYASPIKQGTATQPQRPHPKTTDLLGSTSRHLDSRYPPQFDTALVLHNVPSPYSRVFQSEGHTPWVVRPREDEESHTSHHYSTFSLQYLELSQLAIPVYFSNFHSRNLQLAFSILYIESCLNLTDKNMLYHSILNIS